MTVLAAAAGLLVAAGLALVAGGLRRVPVDPGPVRERRRRRRDAAAARAGMAAGAALAALALTRWPVAAAGAAAATYLVAGRSSRPGPAAEIDRIEAMAAWAEMLRDGVGTPRGIEGIVTATASTAPALIRPTVMRFAHRLAWQDLPDALPGLADELDHRIGDLIVTSLDIAARTGARQVRAVLDDLAGAAREEARMLRRQEVARTRPRAEMHQIAAISVLVVVLLVLVGQDYLAPYRSLVGQAVLCAVAGLWLAGFAAMARLARPRPLERFLAARGPR